MAKRLRRYYGTHDLHFITSSCYRRQPELGSAGRRDLFVKILEEARRKYRRVPKTMRVPHTSRTLRCVGFVTIQMCVDHRDAPTLGIILTA